MHFRVRSTLALTRIDSISGCSQIMPKLSTYHNLPKAMKSLIDNFWCIVKIDALISVSVSFGNWQDEAFLPEKDSNFLMQWYGHFHRKKDHFQKTHWKILKQVEYESAHRKKLVNEKHAVIQVLQYKARVISCNMRYR